ncbi:MAG TPA: chorismate mutase [Rhodospirillaceae bacterium]|nr:chorismate mutase [Rhodospirillaceae bacterium]
MGECRSLAEVRDRIDRLDETIAGLLSQRSDLVRQAARFKDSEAAVVVPERIEAIIGKVRAVARQAGAEEDLLEAIYRSMINIFIEFEKTAWHRLKS